MALFSIQEILIDRKKVQKIHAQQNIPYSQLPKDFQEVFQIDVVDVQKPRDVLPLAEKGNLRFPSGKMVEKLVINSDSPIKNY